MWTRAGRSWTRPDKNKNDAGQQQQQQQQQQ
jgi:hypothetical protein